MISKKTFDFKTNENNFTGVVIEIIIEKDTAFAEVLIKIKARKNIQFLRARITRLELKKMNIKINQKIFAHIKSVSFDRQAII